MKKCPICKKEFIQNSNSQIYCSKQCFCIYVKNYQKEYQENYYIIHKKEIRDKQKIYRNIHQTEMKIYQKDYYKVHGNELNEIRKIYKKNQHLLLIDVIPSIWNIIPQVI